MLSIWLGSVPAQPALTAGGWQRDSNPRSIVDRRHGPVAFPEATLQLVPQVDDLNGGTTGGADAVARRNRYLA